MSTIGFTPEQIRKRLDDWAAKIQELEVKNALLLAALSTIAEWPKDDHSAMRRLAREALK